MRYNNLTSCSIFIYWPYKAWREMCVQMSINNVFRTQFVLSANLISFRWSSTRRINIIYEIMLQRKKSQAMKNCKHLLFFGLFLWFFILRYFLLLLRLLWLVIGKISIPKLNPCHRNWKNETTKISFVKNLMNHPTRFVLLKQREEKNKLLEIILIFCDVQLN